MICQLSILHRPLVYRTTFTYRALYPSALCALSDIDESPFMLRLYKREEFTLSEQQYFLDKAVDLVLIETLLYGIHLVLYGLCAFLLLKRRKSTHLILLIAITIMFILATADISVSFRLLLRDVPAAKKHEIDPSTAHSHSLPKFPLFITNNFIADILLVYRCYMVWGKRKYILVGSMALLVADTILGYINADRSIFFYQKVMLPLFISTTLAINVIMTVATAGRIWWTIHTARPLLPEQTIRRCAVALAVLIESGAIYSASLVLFLFPPVFLLCLPIRLVGIMPTLMIVQVEFGRSFYLKVETPSPRTPLFLNPPGLEGPVKNWETLESSTGILISPPAGVPLTLVMERFRDPSEFPPPGTSPKRPLYVQPNPKETLVRKIHRDEQPAVRIVCSLDIKGRDRPAL